MVYQLPVLGGERIKGKALTASVALISGVGECHAACSASRWRMCRAGPPAAQALMPILLRRLPALRL
jgi:hypothetical protein